MSPTFPVPTDERGAPLEVGFYTVSGELFDRTEPTPAELLYMLETDSNAQAMYCAIALPLQRAELTIVPSPGDKGEAEFVRKILFDPPQAGGMKTPMGAVVQQMISAVFVKRAYFEKVWRKREDGKAVYEKIAFRPVTNCTTLVKNRDLHGFKQRGTNDVGEPFDEDFLVKDRKCFIYFHQQATKPFIGTSILQTAFGDFMDKLRVSRLWNIHLQNYALGTWVGRYTGAIRGAARKLFNKLRRFMGGGGILVLENGEEATMQSKTGAGAEFEAKAKYLDTQMMGSAMLRWQLLGTGSNTGSWALSRDHSDFFLMLEESELDDMAEQVTYGIIADLVEVNFGIDAAFPTAKFDPLAEESLDSARDAYMTLSTSAYRPVGPLWQALEERFARAVDIPLEVVEKQHEYEAKGGGLPPNLDPAQTPQGLITQVQSMITKQRSEQDRLAKAMKNGGGNTNGNGSGPTPPPANPRSNGSGTGGGT